MCVKYLPMTQYFCQLRIIFMHLLLNLGIVPSLAQNKVIYYSRSHIYNIYLKE